MKNINQFLNNKKLNSRPMLDEKSVFYVFQAIISEEYGRQGAENIKPIFFRDKKIFIKSGRPTWTNEILFNREYIVKKVNAQLGGSEIIDLAMTD